MKIGGITKLTSLDFPGKLAVTVYTQGCNRKCDYCHNSELIPFNAGILTWEDVFELISKRKHFIDAVVFSGGEPTLQSDIAEKIKLIIDLGLKVGLHTNGDGGYLRDIQHLDYCLLSHYNDDKIDYIKNISNIVELSDVKLIDGKYENIKTKINTIIKKG